MKYVLATVDLVKTLANVFYEIRYTDSTLLPFELGWVIDASNGVLKLSMELALIVAREQLSY